MVVLGIQNAHKHLHIFNINVVYSFWIKNVEEKSLNIVVSLRPNFVLNIKHKIIVNTIINKINVTGKHL